MIASPTNKIPAAAGRWQPGGRNLLLAGGYLALTALFLVLTRLISDLGFRFAAAVYPVGRQIDPDGAFLFITLHHLFQALLALGLIFLLVKALRLSWSSFGFNRQQWPAAVRSVLLFCVGWFVFQGVIAAIMIRSGTPPVPFSFPLDVRNFSGYLLFQVLLSGSSEEILFRSLIIAPLLVAGSRLGIRERRTAVLATLTATLCFMAGHVNFELHPFRITYFSPLQQATVVLFGLYYAYLFVKTRSLVGPILAHNLLNGVIVTIGLLMNVLFP